MKASHAVGDEDEDESIGPQHTEGSPCGTCSSSGSKEKGLHMDGIAEGAGALETSVQTR